MNTVEKIEHKKDCHCAKCKKLLFIIEIPTLNVNIQIDAQRNKTISIKCHRCKYINMVGV